MALVVQKYGGSSVADAQKIKNVAKRIADCKKKGDQVVVVVSAMGDTTDDLIQLAKTICSKPDKRELDVLLSTGEIVSSTLLAMCLTEMGCQSISLNGQQAGIQTDTAYSSARILKVEARRVKSELEKGNVVIVAGFQGITASLDITTLGRGGSDTTAVALAAALGAKVVGRYTDTEGVFTADPRVVPDAKPLSEISYEEMLELATYGSKVIHPRAVELGELYNIPILVASSFNDKPGTLIHGEVSMENRNKVRSVCHDLDIAKITVVGIPDRPGIASALFVPLAEAGLSVDTIVQNASVNNITDLTFTTTKGEFEKSMAVINPLAKSIGAKQVSADSKVGKVSIIGTGMQNTPGYAARMFNTLSKEGINILLISTSEIRITCIIAEDRVKDAVKALHKAFQLDQVKS